jgi:hypothetical protein
MRCATVAQLLHVDRHRVDADTRLPRRDASPKSMGSSVDELSITIGALPTLA